MNRKPVKCDCNLTWCKELRSSETGIEIQENENKHFVLPRLRQKTLKVREEVLQTLRNGCEIRNVQTRYRFLYWHLKPESFFWQTKFDRRAHNSTPRWAIRSPIVTTERTIPPPMSHNAVWTANQNWELIEGPTDGDETTGEHQEQQQQQPSTFLSQSSSSSSSKADDSISEHIEFQPAEFYESVQSEWHHEATNNPENNDESEWHHEATNNPENMDTGFYHPRPESSFMENLHALVARLEAQVSWLHDQDALRRNVLDLSDLVAAEFNQRKRLAPRHELFDSISNLKGDLDASCSQVTKRMKQH